MTQVHRLVFVTFGPENSTELLAFATGDMVRASYNPGDRGENDEYLDTTSQGLGYLRTPNSATLAYGMISRAF